MNTANCKIPGEFHFVSLGDIHLGHASTPTRITVKGLIAALPDELMRTLDMVILTGDVFDHLLHAEEDELYQAHRWMSLLLYKCATHKVDLTVVEGTPFHDRHQSRYFVEQAANAGIVINLHYATTLSIVHFEKYDAHFLFVPDKCRGHTDEILADVKALLIEHNLTQVDYAVMHGAFRYQFPDVVTEPTHDERSYLDRVKRYILIGHVHTRSQYERILPAGSFDRHHHGDEIAKGYYEIIARDNGQDTIIFHENKYAKRYDTIECHGMDQKELNVAVRKKLSHLPKGSAIKLRCDVNDVATGDIKFYTQEFPQYTWDLHVEKQTKPKESIVKAIASIDLSSFVPIDKNSILTLIDVDIEKYTRGDQALHEQCMAMMDDLR